MAAASARLPRVRMSAEARQSLRQSTCRYIEAATVSPGLQGIGAQLCQGLILFCRGERCCRFLLCGNGGTSCGAWAALRFGFCGRLRGSGLRGFRLGDRCLGRGSGFRCGLGGDCCGFFLFRQRAAGRFQAVFAKFGVFVQQQGALLRVIFHGPIGKGVLFLLGKVFSASGSAHLPRKASQLRHRGVAAAAAG